MAHKTKGFRERLRDGDTIICAEGYLFELECRGYLKAGAFVPEVVLDHPDVVRMLHEEFVHAGSDVVEALTYYGHRAKMQIIGRENELEKMNMTALKIAREVADKTGTLMAGNISNTTIWKPDDPAINEMVLNIFKEQVEWAVKGGADYIIAETFCTYGEAQLALESIQKFGGGLPSVITMAAAATTDDVTYDGVPFEEACRRLEANGADVVGLNCSRGPETILPLIVKVRQVCKGPVACIPLPYRTNQKWPVMQMLMDAKTGEPSFPLALDSWLCSRHEIAKFAKEMKEMGVNYMGICCGNRSHFIRQMAEAVGRTPPASRYSADLSQHLSQLGKTSEEHSWETKNWHRTNRKM